MKVYEPQHIRNLALLGHAGAGKTSFAEALLFETGSNNRRGTVEENNTTSDYSEIEHERGCSIYATPLFTEWNDFKFNIIDTPGFDDYIGEVVSTLRIVDTGVVVLNAQNGLEVGSENAWEYASKYNTPVMFLINKLDQEQANFENVVSELKDRFSNSVTLIQYPIGKGAGFNSIIDLVSMKLVQFPAGGGQPEIKDIPADELKKAESLRNELVESVAETKEDLMNTYLDAGELSDAEFKSGLKWAISSRSIFPVLCAASKHNIGTNLFLSFVKDFCPSPMDLPPVKTTEGNEVACDPKGPNALFIFKLVSEAHLGDMTFFRVMSGNISSGNDLINAQKNSSERLNQLFCVNGKKRTEVASLQAGDIGATVKLKTTQIAHSLHEKGKAMTFEKFDYPNYKVRTAVVPKTKGEEEKVGMALNNIHQEDPTLKVEHSQELRQTILYAQGELHLAAAKWRLLNRYKVEAEFIEPRVPYRETIQKQVKGSYRHKKQSGGAGQFAEVHMMIEPWYENMPDPQGIAIRGRDLNKLDWGGNLEYINSIVGGVIDQRFMPAILKGIMEKMQFGPLTGSYVRDIRVCIYDGKMHPVDSNEAAFKTAGMMAFKDCFIQASPKLLEPIYNVEIKVPEEFVGDVMSDLPTRRGVILGIDSDGRYQKIIARMPLAELDKYSTGLRSMTQGKATYNSKFAEYQAVPPNVQQELIDAYKKQLEDEA